jgi:molybdate transport system regulatory protein
VRLLELIAETGSISEAARQMEMSYRRAWLLIDEVNGIFGKPVVETATGGAGGGGAKITPLGEAVVAAFRAIENEATELIQLKLAKLLAQRGRAHSEA